MLNLYFACDFCQSLISVILTLLCLGGEILGFLVHTLCISTLDCVCVLFKSELVWLFNFKENQSDRLLFWSIWKKVSFATLLKFKKWRKYC